jgi:hypothetical protein
MLLAEVRGGLPVTVSRAQEEVAMEGHTLFVTGRYRSSTNGDDFLTVKH